MFEIIFEYHLRKFKGVCFFILNLLFCALNLRDFCQHVQDIDYSPKRIAFEESFRLEKKLGSEFHALAGLRS